MVQHGNKRGTGSSGVDMVWDIERYQWIKQIIIWIGNNMHNRYYGKWDPNLSRDISVMNNPPDWFNIDNLGKLEYYENYWWDEPINILSLGSSTSTKIFASSSSTVKLIAIF